MRILLLACLVGSLPCPANVAAAGLFPKWLGAAWVIVPAGERDGRAAVAAALDADFRDPLPIPMPAAQGQIVVRLDAEGKARGHDGRVLADEAALMAYLDRRLREVENPGVVPRLKLAVDEGVHFVSVRKVIRAAAKVGINEVIFVSVGKKAGEAKEPDGEAGKKGGAGKEEAGAGKRVEREEGDIERMLPIARPIDAQPAMIPFFIKLDAKGRVYVNPGAAQELLDAEAAARELPLLDRRVELYAAAARLGEEEPVVQLYAEPGVRQGRVMQVIDVLRKHRIDQVTFVDLIGEE